MRLGKIKIFIFAILFFIGNITILFSADKIEAVPLINLEELSPTFEEDKDILEQIEDQNTNLQSTNKISEENKTQKNDKVYILVF